ncbi:protein of unknown function [Methylorubrum extorquens]|uniref:Uncharacterized protein n=1 Tax=Methylorubrum extorquens TaxID=408 RepID=A0A2N9AMQ4_METEX|nr:protein of unknown function [Methylorubrum extorquens]
MNCELFAELCRLIHVNAMNGSAAVFLGSLNIQQIVGRILS